MALIRHLCAVGGCARKVTVPGRICEDHQYEARQRELDALVAELEETRQRLGLSKTWGCLDPECEICS